jgi:hypothetical protein
VKLRFALVTPRGLKGSLNSGIRVHPFFISCKSRKRLISYASTVKLGRHDHENKLLTLIKGGWRSSRVVRELLKIIAHENETFSESMYKGRSSAGKAAVRSIGSALLEHMKTKQTCRQEYNYRQYVLSSHLNVSHLPHHE